MRLTISNLKKESYLSSSRKLLVVTFALIPAFICNVTICYCQSEIILARSLNRLVTMHWKCQKSETNSAVQLPKDKHIRPLDSQPHGSWKFCWHFQTETNNYIQLHIIPAVPILDVPIIWCLCLLSRFQFPGRWFWRWSGSGWWLASCWASACAATASTGQANIRSTRSTTSESRRPDTSG